RVVRIIQLCRIQAKQNVYFISRPRLRLINFIIFDESLGKMAHRRKIGRFVDDRSIEGAPGMLIKPAADHLSVLRPGVIGIERRVNAYESLAVVMNEGENVGLLTSMQIEFSSCAGKNHKVEVVEGVRVCAQ